MRRARREDPEYLLRRLWRGCGCPRCSADPRWCSSADEQLVRLRPLSRPGDSAYTFCVSQGTPQDGRWCLNAGHQAGSRRRTAAESFPYGWWWLRQCGEGERGRYDSTMIPLSTKGRKEGFGGSASHCAVHRAQLGEVRHAHGGRSWSRIDPTEGTELSMTGRQRICQRTACPMWGCPAGSTCRRVWREDGPRGCTGEVGRNGDTRPRHGFFLFLFFSFFLFSYFFPFHFKSKIWIQISQKNLYSF